MTAIINSRLLYLYFTLYRAASSVGLCKLARGLLPQSVRLFVRHMLQASELPKCAKPLCCKSVRDWLTALRWRLHTDNRWVWPRSSGHMTAVAFQMHAGDDRPNIYRNQHQAKRLAKPSRIHPKPGIKRTRAHRFPQPTVIG